MNEQHSLLEHNFSGVAENLFQNQMKNARITTYGHRYTDEIKQFAMTLHYYSPKAYDFVRKLLALPHPSSIKAWAASVDCNPGYLMNVIKCIGSQVAKKPWMSDVVLIVDAMAIHKDTTWDPKTKQFVWNCRLWYGNARSNGKFSHRSISIYDSRINRTFQTSSCLCAAR